MLGDISNDDDDMHSKGNLHDIWTNRCLTILSSSKGFQNVIKFALVLQQGANARDKHKNVIAYLGGLLYSEVKVGKHS